MADVENVDMIEVDENDENDKIETLDFAVDQGDCVVHVGGASVGGGSSIKITDI